MDMDDLNRKTRAKRETLGLNVRFIRKDGRMDEFSFATSDRADAFREQLRRDGIEPLS